MNRLDTFNKDKSKCLNCKQYFDKKEMADGFNQNYCFHCCKKLLMSQGYKVIQIDDKLYIFNDMNSIR